MRHTDGADHVTQLLEQQLVCANTLLDTLRREQIALTRNDIADLETAVAAKHRHLHQLDALSRRTDEALRSTGLRDVDAWLRTRSDAVAEGAWKKLRHILGECQLQNQINGTLIEQGRHRVQQALNLLTGRDAENAVYRQDGAKDMASRARLTARA